VSIASASEAIRRGCAQVISEPDLAAKLKTGRPLLVKYGADPSAPDLHLGHAVVLRKLRQLQELGHTVQFLIGDFTGMIGDPTGRSATRPPLTREQILANAQTYQNQVFKILLPERTQVVFNSTWCSPMTFAEIIRLAARTTVARILERDDFEKRYREGRPIGLHELLYPLIQGYDSVVLKSDIEMCGTDQIFNCLVARALQADEGQEPEVILAMPLLEGLDGVQKMSKSLGNYVGITETPKEMYGKLMSLPDSLMLKYFQLLTPISESEWLQIKADLESGVLHPRAAKARLAATLVEQFHDRAAAEAAAQEFDRIFRDRQMPGEMPEVALPVSDLKAGKIWILKLLTDKLGSECLKSNEAQRLIKQGAVEVDGERVADFRAEVEIKSGEGTRIKIGKRKFIKVTRQN
jgi:tyrosyl-tRNA synthetase